MKSITIEHNMAIECITTMIRIAELDHFENYIEQHSFTENRSIQKKLQEMRNQLSAFEKSDLDILFRKFKLNFYYLLMFITETGTNTVEELLIRLKELSSDQYLKECFRVSSFNISLESEDELVYDEVIRNHPIEVAQLYVEFKNDAILLKKKLVSSIESFYKKAFEKEENWIKQQLAPILCKHANLFEENRKAFIDTIGNGDYSNMLNGDHQYRIYICYLEEFIPRCLFDKGNYTFVYGFSEEQKLIRSNATLNQQELFKTLSDETRLKIISLLSKKKWTRKNLVKEIGLTSATMTYQLNKLIELGVIELTIGDSKKSLYGLNKDKFKQLVNHAIDEIIR